MRPSKYEYYLKIADAVSERSTCLRRRYGAVIVANDEIISTGYNGAPRDIENCIDCGKCWREEHNIPSGTMYEKCVAVHAEANAIISAARRDMLGGYLFLSGRDATTGELIDNPMPCLLCARLILNSGLEAVISYNHGRPEVSPVKFIIYDLVRKG